MSSQEVGGILTFINKYNCLNRLGYMRADWLSV